VLGNSLLEQSARTTQIPETKHRYMQDSRLFVHNKRKQNGILSLLTSVCDQTRYIQFNFYDLILIIIATVTCPVEKRGKLKHVNKG
jgi:hypothetical protein